MQTIHWLSNLIGWYVAFCFLTSNNDIFDFMSPEVLFVIVKERVVFCDGRLSLVPCVDINKSNNNEHKTCFYVRKVKVFILYKRLLCGTQK